MVGVSRSGKLLIPFFSSIMVSENLHAVLENDVLRPSCNCPIRLDGDSRGKNVSEIRRFFGSSANVGLLPLAIPLFARGSRQTPPRLPRQDSKRRGLVRSQHKIQPRKP